MPISGPVSPLVNDRQHRREVIRVTWIGLLVNVALSAVKLAAGVFAFSQTMIADGIHSLSDSSTDVAILVGVRFWMKPPDAEHPHGHRRIETIITSGIGMVLAVVGAGIVYNALKSLMVHPVRPPGLLAFFAALISIASKETLYQWTVRVGKRIHSPAVIANAWHHRSDALSSIPAAIAVGGARLVPEWHFLDPVGAVVVSLFIFQAAWRITMPALGILVDTAAPPEDRKRIEQIVLSLPEIKHVHEIRTRYIGPGLQVDLHIMIDGNLTVNEGHDLSEEVKQVLLDEGPNVVDVVVHIEPYDMRR